ncbi:MAG TPA: SMC family ATPase [Anaerolineales bacterium]|nr:SMC family ATPase [Anaerolineales bacterium]
MIPISLSLSGFLSYLDPVELDFSGIELACIAGSNGAGKSSLLDAITWALFGQARKRDDALINARASAADVCLTFAYEGNTYRVKRLKPREKATLLELYILQDGSQGSRADSAVWKPLTERTLRDTEARIGSILRMDYETFVNASFFLQGKADQFTQQRPGDRKRILSSILGLEIWEAYRGRAAERRKDVEEQINAIDGRLQEIDAELAEESSRKARLEELQQALELLSRARQAQESVLESIRQAAARLADQRKLVDMLDRQLQAASQRLNEIEARLAARRAEREAFGEILDRAPHIQTTYSAWEQARARLEHWESIAAQFREHEKRRQIPRDEINAARAALLQEQQGLRAIQSEVDATRLLLPELQAQLARVQEAVQAAEGQLARRALLDDQLQAARQRQAEARAENPRLKAEMDELKERITQLSEVEGAACPLCGQPLSSSDRQVLITGLKSQGQELGDRYRANKALVEETGQLVRALEGQVRELSQAEEQARTHHQVGAQLRARLEVLEADCDEWEVRLAPRLAEVSQSLDAESFAPPARARLAEIDSELAAIGYAAAEHDADRRAESEGRASQAEMRALEKAQATLAPLEREIASLESQAENQRAEVAREQEEHQAAAADLAAAQAQAPDLEAAERELFQSREQENNLLKEVGAARQKVLVLEDLKIRRRGLEAERATHARRVGQFKQIERAFGKDGVPALLIEQALPQIETRANEILDRLSSGTMTVRFLTQAAFKDKKREDLKETLDIVISDGAGTRDYELFSGGEAFRVNFAIRLALSEVLSHRAGARLQTLVIDEGFGSQDAQGRQRLIEAINLVSPDFAKILVITHIDELKDVFPTRIEVEKTPRGSTLKVV